MIAYATYFGFISIGLAVLMNLHRLIVGPDSINRILALDTLTINTIALFILFGIWQGSSTNFEAALLFAMVGFITTVAFCKYLLRGDIIE
ncbi:K+/H+ antiporter subunit F [Fodinicurvata sediminis]|uniref:K+/H+ antiporter subunit F n=1 Tax=Fodinicurvata sediminis TaxID=1121832 RepID=UPI0003B4E3DE|nr:K+/H+ antiporter subunit F [Fodinicurvata sediminis]